MQIFKVPERAWWNKFITVVMETNCKFFIIIAEAIKYLSSLPLTIHDSTVAQAAEQLLETIDSRRKLDKNGKQLI